MKKLFVILFLIHILFVKGQEKNLDKNSVQTIVGTIDKRDLNCLSEIKRAKIDFKIHEVFYELIPEGYLDDDYNRHYPHLIKLLQEKGIDFCETYDFDSFWSSDDENRYRLIYNCYYKASNELLNENMEKTSLQTLLKRLTVCM